MHRDVLSGPGAGARLRAGEVLPKGGATATEIVARAAAGDAGSPARARATSERLARALARDRPARPPRIVLGGGLSALPRALRARPARGALDLLRSRRAPGSSRAVRDSQRVRGAAWPQRARRTRAERAGPAGGSARARGGGGPEEGEGSARRAPFRADPEGRATLGCRGGSRLGLPNSTPVRRRAAARSRFRAAGSGARRGWGLCGPVVRGSVTASGRWPDPARRDPGDRPRSRLRVGPAAFARIRSTSFLRASADGTPRSTRSRPTKRASFRAPQPT